MFWIVRKCLTTMSQKFIIPKSGYKSSTENLCMYVCICLYVIYKKQKKRVYLIGQATIPSTSSLTPVNYGNVCGRLFLYVFPLGYCVNYPEVLYSFLRLRKNEKECSNTECLGAKAVSWCCLLYQKNFY